MFKSFVLGLYASGHSLHVRVTQTFAVNRFRTGAIYSMHSKTTHRLSFLKDDAKVLLIFSAKVQKMHFALREFFTLLDKLYAIFHTNYSMYSDY